MKTLPPRSSPEALARTLHPASRATAFAAALLLIVAPGCASVEATDLERESVDRTSTTTATADASVLDAAFETLGTPTDELAPSFPAQVTISVPPASRYSAPEVWGTGIPARIGGAAQTPEVFYASFDATGDWIRGRDHLAGLGIGSLRFPQGCDADIYEWRSGAGGTAQTRHRATDGTITARPALDVQEAARIASDVGARFVYTLNMEHVRVGNGIAACENSTQNTDPCNYSSPYSVSRTLPQMIDDVRQLARTHGSRIGAWELGNEPWAGTAGGAWHWSPSCYTEVARRVADALRSEGQLQPIMLVGYPSSGNNQTGGEGVPENDQWTAAVASVVNATCRGRRCFDVVTDHVYSRVGFNPRTHTPQNFTGMGAWFPVTNLPVAIIDRRADYGVGAGGPSLAHTEWNMICWGESPETPMYKLYPAGCASAPQYCPTLDGFESGTVGPWATYRRYNSTPGSVSVATVPGEINRALRINHPSTSSTPGFDMIQAYQRLVVPMVNGHRMTRLGIRMRARVSHPSRVRVVIQRGDGDYRHYAETRLVSLVPNQWQNVTLGVTLPDDVASVQFVLRVLKNADEGTANVDAYFDDIEIIGREQYPYNPATNTVEGGLFTAETVLRSATAGLSYATYHGLYQPGPAYGCQFHVRREGRLELAPNGQAFAFTQQFAGLQILNAAVSSPSMTFPTETSPPTTVLPVPAAGCRLDSCLRATSARFVSAYAGRNGTHVVVYVINRHPTDTATVDLLGLGGIVPSSAPTIMTTLSGAHVDRSFSQTVRQYSTRNTMVTVPRASMVRVEY